MTQLWAQVVSLGDHHDVESFTCGRAAVDEWFRTKALPSRHHVSTHVCLDEADDVVAFFALKTAPIGTEGMSAKLRGRDGSSPQVASLLCQMGVDRRLQGRGAGNDVLRLAMRAAVEASERSRFALFAVDAADEQLAQWYERCGLKRVGNSLRLAHRISTIKKLIAGQI